MRAANAITNLVDAERKLELDKLAAVSFLSKISGIEKGLQVKLAEEYSKEVEKLRVILTQGK